MTDKKKNNQSGRSFLRSMLTPICIVGLIGWLTYLTMNLHNYGHGNETSSEMRALTLEKIIENMSGKNNEGNKSADIFRNRRNHGLGPDTQEKCEECEECDMDLCYDFEDLQCDATCENKISRCLAKCNPAIINQSGPNLSIRIEKIVKHEIDIMKKDLGRTFKQMNLIKIALSGQEQNIDNLRTIHDNCITQFKITQEWSLMKKAPNSCKPLDANNILKCGPYLEWKSLIHRAGFYENCLKKFKVNDIQRKGRISFNLMQQLAIGIEASGLTFDEANKAANGQMIAGGILGGLGVILTATGVGAPVGLAMMALGAGGVTSVVQEFLGDSWTQGMVEDQVETLKELGIQKDSLASLQGLYISSMNDFEGSRHVKKIIRKLNEVQSSVEEKVVGVIPVAASVLQYRGVITEKLQKVLFEKFPKIKLNIPKPNKHLNIFKGKIHSNVKILNFNSAFTKTLRGIFSGTLKFATATLGVPIGIWSLLAGQKKLDISSDFASTIKYEARKMAQEINQHVKLQHTLFPDDYEYNEDDNIDYISFLEINFNKREFAKCEALRFKISSNESSCTTQIIDSENIISSTDKWAIATHRLKGCSDLPIVNRTAEIRLLADTNCGSVVDGLLDQLGINQINMGLVGNTLPSMVCSNPAEKGDIFMCKAKVALLKIKMHTSNIGGAGTDNNIWASFNFDVKNQEGNLVHSSCNTSWLDNYGNDRERGDTDTYRITKENVGDCNNDIIVQDLNDLKKTEKIRVTLHNEGSWAGGQWNTDAVKVYFSTTKAPKVFHCDMCKSETCSSYEEGWGADIPRNTQKTFQCYHYKPIAVERSVEKIQSRVCDLKYAGSSTKDLRIKICKSKEEFDKSQTDGSYKDILDGTAGCCTTNALGNNGGQFTRGQWATIDGDAWTEKGHDDGGEQLGQCEGFGIEGTEMYIGMYNQESTDALCLEELKFYSSPSPNSTIVDIPVMQCSLTRNNRACQYWTDGGKESNRNYCQGDSTWSPFFPTVCRFSPDKVTVKKIGVKVCNEKGSGSQSEFMVLIKNLDGVYCTFTLNGDLNTGNYMETSSLAGNCGDVQLAKNHGTSIDIATEMWILNKSGQDPLCISDVFVDVLNAKGVKVMLRCRYNNKISGYSKTIVDDEVTGLPLMCGG